jgi:hypothetical protein
MIGFKLMVPWSTSGKAASQKIQTETPPGVEKAGLEGSLRGDGGFLLIFSDTLIAPAIATATAATCTSEVGLVAAPPIAPCSQVQRRKGNNGQQK